MHGDLERISHILKTARESGRPVLLETEGWALLEALGIAIPPYLFVKEGREARTADLSVFSGERVVVKVISPEILHKSDVGGVRIVPNHRHAVVATIELMERKFHPQAPVGFTVTQFVSYDAALGNELLLGARWTEDFGSIVTFGPGGIYTEFLAKNFKDGKDVAVVSSHLALENLEAALASPAVTELVTGRLRGQAPRLPMAQVVDVVERFQWLAQHFMPADILECEINPLVIAEERLVALDILVKLGRGASVAPSRRPIHKIHRLLEPRTAAIIGVSEKLNPGHIILNNLLREGFESSKIYVVKPGLERIEGCSCFPDIASLPETVDLFILSVDAAQAPGLVTEIIEKRKAESLILIPGGLEEKQGTEAIVARMREALASARATEWQGPVINGGNCLGITSRPGRYDTMFIPECKLPVSQRAVAPVAIISQSGAFAVSRASKLAGVNPKYSITVGNQMDLTVGDFLAYLKNDPEIRVFAVYAEGFKPLDGLQLLKEAAEIAAEGRAVIFYRAGRTAAGAQAAASHTASIAGDYAVTRKLAENAGVIVAETIADFEDLVKLFTFLRSAPAEGRRLGAISNAGFECVAFADNLGHLQLTTFDSATTERLRRIFQSARIDKVVDVHNPIDLTPMTGDAPFADAIAAVMEDSGVDVGIVGCVPLTAALNTLPAGRGHGYDVLRDDSIASRMIRLKEKIEKPWVVVIDSGALYDPMAARLEDCEIPVFRCADRALRLLNMFCLEHMKRIEKGRKAMAFAS